MANALAVAAGPMRQRVTLQSPVPPTGAAVDTFGQPNNQSSSGWVNRGTYWASVRDVTGQERLYASQLAAVLPRVVTMRYVPGLGGGPFPSWRVLFGPRVLNVVSVVNADERKRSVELLCDEKVTT